MNDLFESYNECVDAIANVESDLQEQQLQEKDWQLDMTS